MAEERTNVIRILDQKRAFYTLRHYAHPNGAVDGASAAALPDRDPASACKTLVTQGANRQHYVLVTPVLRSLDLKTAARAVGEKSVEMIPQVRPFLLIGYVYGGCPPVGMKKPFPIMLDGSVEGLGTIVVSAGEIGAQAELALTALCALVGGTSTPIFKQLLLQRKPFFRLLVQEARKPKLQGRIQTKKLGTLTLTPTLTGIMILPAPAVEGPELVITPTDTDYSQTIVFNGEALGLIGIPGVSGEELLPLRLLAEADHGSVYWDKENNESRFTFRDSRITVKFTDNSVWLDDQQMKSIAWVADGVTSVEVGALPMPGGYTVDRNSELDVNRIDITTPNNDPVVKAIYQIREEGGVVFGMQGDDTEVVTLFQLPEDTSEQAICFTPMNTTPGIMVLAKPADGADETVVKEAPEAHRQSRRDAFSWYLARNLPKVKDAHILVEGGYAFYPTAENTDAGEATFHVYMEAQAQPIRP